MSRPSKLTEERAERIANLIKGGNYASQAAQAAGVSERSYHRWMQQGAEASSKCEEWQERVDHWNSLNDAQKRSESHLQPSEDEAPTAEEIVLWRFWRDVKKAEAEAEAAAVLQIRKAANEGTWQAAAWYLERKFKDRWSRRDSIDHTGSIDHRVGIGASPEEIEAARARLHAARAELTGDQDPADLPELIEGEAEEITN